MSIMWLWTIIDLQEKYSVDIFIMNKFVLQKSGFHEQLPINFAQEATGCLVEATGCLVEALSWKSGSSEKIHAEKNVLLWKSSCSKKVTVLKIIVVSSQSRWRSGCNEKVLTVNK